MLPLERQNRYRARYQQRRPGWRPSGDEFEALVRRRLGPRARVLDVGCGRGGVMELFWREVGLAVGVDADYASLAEHRTRQTAPPGMPLTGGQVEALPFQTASFDLVLALWVFEHLPRPAPALAELARVLRPGGHLLFLTPNAQHPLIWANRASQWLPALQRALVPRLYGREAADTFQVHYQANSAPRLRELAAAAGFEEVSLRAIADPSYLAFNDWWFEVSLRVEARLPAGWGVHLLGEWRRG